MHIWYFKAGASLLLLLFLLSSSSSSSTLSSFTVSRDSAVSTATRVQVGRSKVQIHVEATHFFLLQNGQAGSGLHPTGHYIKNCNKTGGQIPQYLCPFYRVPENSGFINAQLSSVAQYRDFCRHQGRHEKTLHLSERDIVRKQSYIKKRNKTNHSNYVDRRCTVFEVVR